MLIWLPKVLHYKIEFFLRYIKMFGEILIFGYYENEKLKFHWYATLFNLDDFTAKCKFIVLSQVNGMLLTVKNFC